MKKYLCILMLVLSSFAFGKKLYVGTNAEFVPYEYLEDNKLKGFDIELMEAIGKELGYEIVWTNMGFDGLLPALQMKKIDAVIAGMSPTPEREKAVSFSGPYMLVDSNEHYVLVNSASTITKKEELKGKKVGVQIGTIQEQFTKDLGGIPVLYDGWTNAIMDLKNKKIDGVIIADVTGKKYLETISGIKKVDVVLDKNPGVAIAFRKNDKIIPKINEAIETLDNNGEYLKLLEKYFPQKVEKYKKNRLK
ncbi:MULTISPECIES: transporter substrate-binding domain-containing protein [unclassified Fusobacterium]|uniref:transporter substrate-binding domain-containing protein n=1 Tax=unclassified Fusobacterium TaxID=2648384 RepID=UPI001B8C7286|nr:MULTISPECIES: transporter substrate-binding domain-containing protein [unclassified Fusobacterium]MBR8702267.1 Arginine-binding extracellular protein ArtP [Fusobacterium sp. DD45]MBR8712084.1 Arginine-binding extracellular protein ArtP [Fusobacterium sp. DD28]MBR8752660.1 Arginine-binding extracellular protein ArtP [Fusobacterium sp. DD26]